MVDSAMKKTTAMKNLAQNAGIPGKAIGIATFVVAGMHGTALFVVSYLWAYTHLNLRAIFLAIALLIATLAYAYAGMTAIGNPGPAPTFGTFLAQPTTAMFKLAVIVSIVVEIVCLLVYTGLILVPANEFLGTELLGCDLRPCGINPDCEIMSETFYPQYYVSPYSYDDKTIPPVDIDDSVDNKRQKGPCECNYPYPSSLDGFSATSNCQSERAFNYTYRVWNPPLADEDDEKYGFTGGFCNTLLCPSVGELRPINCTIGETSGCGFNGELVHWTRLRVQFYLYGPLIYIPATLIVQVLLYIFVSKLLTYFASQHKVENKET